MNRSSVIGGKRSKREKELVTINHECYALIALAIICMVIGFILATLEVTEELLYSVSMDAGSTSPITTHKEFTYKPYWIPGLYFFGLGVVMLIGSLLRWDINDGRLWRIRSGLSEKKKRPRGARIPISETKFYGYLMGSVTAIGSGITSIVFGRFFWQHPMLDAITYSSGQSEYFLGYGIYYPFRDLAIFLGALGIGLLAFGLISLIVVVILYFLMGPRKTH